VLSIQIHFLKSPSAPLYKRGEYFWMTHQLCFATLCFLSRFFKGGSISPSLIKGRSGWIYKNALTLFFQGPGSHIQRTPLGVAQRASLRREPGPFILFFLKIPPHPRLLPNGEKEINPPQSPLCLLKYITAPTLLCYPLLLQSVC